MNHIIDHPVFTSIRQAREFYRIRRAGSGPLFAAMDVKALIVTFYRSEKFR